MPADPRTRTVSALWSRAVSTPSAAPAYLAEEPGGWRPVGFPEAGRRVEEMAAGLVARGVRPGDRVAILGRTRLEWALADLAAIAAGAVVVPVYPAATADDTAHVLGHSGTRLLICEDATQGERTTRLPGLDALDGAITMDPSDDDLDGLAARGRELLARDSEAVERVREAIRPDDLLTLVYTSGTTGPPKGCMLTHANYAAMVEMALAVPDLVVPGEVVLLHLPLAHVFARLVPFAAASAGVTVAFCADASRLTAAVAAVRPTLLPSVPRVFEAVHAGVLREIDRGGAVRRRVGRAALAAGRRAAERRAEGRPAGPWLSLRLRAADRLVLARVRERLGGRLRQAISGGAKLPAETAWFFEAIGVPVLEGYGLTECTTVASVNRLGRRRVGTVGPPLPGVEVEISPDGEILVRGENVFAGYHRDEEATRAVLGPGGRLRTGDLGSLDADGFLTITDRTKDIIVTSDGHNVSPARLEAALRASPFVSEALVVGHGRPYVAALLAPDTQSIRAAGRSDEDVQRALAAAVAEVNRAHGGAARVRAFALLSRELSVEDGEITPTLKVRRHVCEARFREEIEALYAAGASRGAGSA